MSFVFLAVNGHLIRVVNSFFLSRVDLQEAVGRALSRVQRVLFVGDIREPKSSKLWAVVNTKVVKNLTFFVEHGDQAVFGGLLVVKARNKELSACVHGQGSGTEASRELVEH